MKNITSRKRKSVHIEVIVHRPPDKGEHIVNKIRNALCKAKRKEGYSYQIIDNPSVINQIN